MSEFPECPKCGHGNDDWYDEAVEACGDLVDCECPDCGEKFQISAEERIEFVTQPIPNPTPARKDR